MIVEVNRGATMVFEVVTALSIVIGEARQPAVAQPVELGQRAFVHYAQTEWAGVLKGIRSKDFNRAGHGHLREIGVGAEELRLFKQLLR